MGVDLLYRALFYTLYKLTVESSKHMVSLRGSKFGAKVGMLCCNPAYATRPGPGVGPFMSRFGPGRLGPAYR